MSLTTAQSVHLGLTELKDLRDLLDKFISKEGVMDTGAFKSSVDALHRDPAMSPLMKSQINTLDSILTYSQMVYFAEGHRGVYRLPDDVLGRIFELAVPAFNSNKAYIPPHLLRDRLRASVALSAVSRRFRDIALAQPMLWTDLSPLFGAADSTIPILIKRGQGAGFNMHLIDIVERVDGKVGDLEGFHETTLLRSQDCRSIRVSSINCRFFIPALEVHKPTFGRLQELIMACHDTGELLGDGPCFPQVYTKHALRVLDLISLSTPSFRNTLRHLTFDVNVPHGREGDLNAFMHAIVPFQALKDLRLYVSVGDWRTISGPASHNISPDMQPWTPPPAGHFPDLRHLTLQVQGSPHKIVPFETLLDFFPLDRLCGLRLGWLEFGVEGLRSALNGTIQIVKTKYGTLRGLKSCTMFVRGRGSPEGIRVDGLLSLMPALDTLKLVGGFTPPRYLDLQGAYDPYEHPVPIPRLRRLAFAWNTQLNARYLGALVKMLHEQKLGGEVELIIAASESVKDVRFLQGLCDDVKVSHIENIKHFKLE